MLFEDDCLEYDLCVIAGIGLCFCWSQLGPFVKALICLRCNLHCNLLEYMI